VEADITGRRVEDAFVIPREALRAGDRVYVVEDGRLDIRTVTVIHSTDNEAVIAAGVAPGDHVIVSSVRNPIEGMALEAMRNAFDESAVAERHHRPMSAGS